MVRPKKNVNIYSIAEAAEVSIATVSRVLNNRHDVSPEARERVKRTLQEYGFIPSQNVAKKGSIGIVLPGWMKYPSLSFYDTRIIEGIASYSLANEIDSALIFYSLDQGSKGVSIVDTLRKRSCSSALILRPFDLEPQLDDLSRSGMPVMLLNYRKELPGIGYIDCDAFDAGRLLGAHLRSLGHRHVAFLQNATNSLNHVDREHGFFEAFIAAGGRQEDCAVIPTNEGAVDRAYLQTEKVLRDYPEITAIVAINDENAYEVLQACHKNGRRVPDDISVAGFDNYVMSSRIVPALTTVEQPLFEMGRMAAAVVNSLQAGTTVFDLLRTVLPVKLIVRESTGSVNRFQTEN